MCKCAKEIVWEWDAENSGGGRWHAVVDGLVFLAKRNTISLSHRAWLACKRENFFSGCINDERRINIDGCESSRLPSGMAVRQCPNNKAFHPDDVVREI